MEYAEAEGKVSELLRAADETAPELLARQAAARKTYVDGTVTVSLMPNRTNCSTSRE